MEHLGLTYKPQQQSFDLCYEKYYCGSLNQDTAERDSSTAKLRTRYLPNPLGTQNENRNRFE